MAARRLSRIPEVVITWLITRQMERTSKGTHPITKTPHGAVAAAPFKASGLVQFKDVAEYFLIPPGRAPALAAYRSNAVLDLDARKSRHNQAGTSIYEPGARVIVIAKPGAHRLRRALIYRGN